MSLVGLSDIQILRGTLSLIFVLISILIGIRMVLKYFKYKRKQLATIGLTWIFLSSAWWGGAFAFLFYLLFDITLSPEVYLFIGNFFIPIALIMWIYSFTTLGYSEYKKKIFYPYIVISLGFMIFMVIALFTDYTLIGTVSNLNSEHSDIMLGFVVFALVSTLITGLIFAKKSMGAADPTIKWKGRFLFFAFLVFVIGALLDAIIPPIPVLLVLIKVVLAISGILYEFGFFLPKFIQDKLE